MHARRYHDPRRGFSPLRVTCIVRGGCFAEAGRPCGGYRPGHVQRTAATCRLDSAAILGDGFRVSLRRLLLATTWRTPCTQWSPPRVSLPRSILRHTARKQKLTPSTLQATFADRDSPDTAAHTIKPRVRVSLRTGLQTARAPCSPAPAACTSLASEWLPRQSASQYLCSNRGPGRQARAPCGTRRLRCQACD